jgi:hypothetical protein
MADRHYNWQRFWCPPDGVLPLTDGGYLLDLGPSWLLLDSCQLSPFRSIADSPCLGLLGEPGMGKSTEMRLQYGSLAREAQAAGDSALWFDLRNYTTDTSLRADIFDGPVVREWLAGTNRLHLFLDSLDEGLLSVSSLATLLPDRLEGFGPSLERLSLRVACRTLEWPPVLEAGLRSLWGEDVVKIYELAPLRRRDIAEAAQVCELDPEAFLTEVERSDAIALAIKPVTLRFLLGAYRHGRGLPANRWELYEQGCRILCGEGNPSRRERDLRRNAALSTAQRFAVAARLAAVTVFANRAAVWIGPDDGDVPESDLRLTEVCGASEEYAGQAVEVTESAVREALNTGLFNSRGAGRMGWAHQSYAEFLAAWHLVHRKMPGDAMASLIVHPQAPGGRIVPQLYEAAAWLAGHSPRVLQRVARTDPQVLLRGDIAAMDPDLRKELTASILGGFEREELLDNDRRLRQGYARLAHPGIADQLRPYITSRQAGWLVRRVAIEIAEACGTRQLQCELLRVALDPEDEYYTRVNAACAAARIADDEAKLRLRPLAFGECGADPDDELKGWALGALWPGHITAQELLPLITPPRRPNLFGAYGGFLRYELTAGLQPHDLPAAVDWVSSRVQRGGPDWLEELADRIMVRAVGSLDEPGVLEAVARAGIPFLTELRYSMRGPDDDSFEKHLERDEAARHRVVGAMLPLLDPDSDGVFDLLHPPAIVSGADLTWLIGLLARTDAAATKRLIIRLVDRLFPFGDVALTELVFQSAKRNPALWEQLRPYFEPMRLDSPGYRQQHEFHLRIQERQRDRESGLLQRQDSQMFVAAYAEELGAGDWSAWWRLVWAMSRGAHSPYEPDVTALPGWPHAVTLMGTAELLRAARAYLVQGDAEVTEWLGRDVVHWPALAGYRAARLLATVAPCQLRQLPDEVWSRWASAIIWYPSPGEARIHKEMVARAYRAAPEGAICALGLLVDEENRGYDRISAIDQMELCWDDQLGEAILAKVVEPGLKPSCMGALLAELLKRGAPGSRAFADRLLALPIPAAGDARARALAAGVALMRYADDGGWPASWAAMQADAEFGRALVVAVATHFEARESRASSRLSDVQLADLYIWVARAYPPSEDPDRLGPGGLGVREEIARWRDSLLAVLKSRGTFSSYGEVERVAGTLPEVTSLRWHVLEAQDVTYRNTWQPPSPVQVLRLSRESEVRLVRNSGELRALVAASLERLQTKLQGELAAVADLWNDRPRTPKDEGRLSDYIARHLRDDLRARGVVANREVLVNRGSETDIHVDAVAQPTGSEYGAASVIVEVKGCWHREVSTAMETQLAGQYMAASPRSLGLYVVGWFQCSEWDDGDSRKHCACYESIGAAKEDLVNQAARLSADGVPVEVVVLDVSLQCSPPSSKRGAKRRRSRPNGSSSAPTETR